VDDPTVAVRRQLARDLNSAPRTRERLHRDYGSVWDTAQLAQEFDVIGFGAPLVVVRRRSDGCLGSLLFQHAPRFYFEFVPD
jgi:hypothetical protein